MGMADSNSSSSKGSTSRKPNKNHLIFLDGGLPDGSEVAYVSRGEQVLKGFKQGRGIYCNHCNNEVSPSEFEKHAGFESRRKPYENIFILNGSVKGRSLSDYASRLKQSPEQLCIKRCSSLDIECKYKTSIPFKKRFCSNCLENSMFAGRIDIVACVLCRSSKFCKSGFNDSTSIVCDQCEKEYHIGCLREYNIDDLKELPSGNWFCTEGCEKLHSDLEALVTRGPHKVSGSDAEWIIFRGKSASGENKLLLDQAVKTFHECFNPILDSETRKDMISLMAYGEEASPSDFSGVHCAMITINSKVVTAGLFRLLGHAVAELPIVATSQCNQGKGYFRLFLDHFESLLSKFKIKKLVLPAAKNAKAMWTHKFGFRVVTPGQRIEYRQVHTAMITFDGTILLEKVIPERLGD